MIFSARARLLMEGGRMLTAAVSNIITDRNALDTLKRVLFR